jgi:hypothetical protein
LMPKTGILSSAHDDIIINLHILTIQAVWSGALLSNDLHYDPHVNFHNVTSLIKKTDRISFCGWPNRCMRFHTRTLHYNFLRKSTVFNCKNSHCCICINHLQTTQF